MARKNISKTAIEGGRYGRNKWERRESNQLERVNTRLLIASAQNDVEELADVVMPERRHVSKEFKDKLSPVYRWLDSHIGELWDDVRSKIASEFDGRTTAGRHILHDHILQSVQIPGALNDYYDYYIDDAGLLQKRHSRRRWWRHKAEPNTPVCNRKKNLILKWMGVRRIGVRGDKIYWFEPTSSGENVIVTWGTKFYYTYSKGSYWSDTNNLYYWVNRKQAIYETTVDGKFQIKCYEETLVHWSSGYRQSKEFSKKDLEFWLTIPEWFRNNILKRSPLLPPEKKPW